MADLNINITDTDPAYLKTGVKIVGIVEPVFSPDDIAGLKLWIDFSDISTLYTDSAKTTPVTADNDVIGAAEDKSGNGNDHTQTTTAAKPTYKTGIQNSLSIGRGDGGDELLLNPNALSQPFTLLAVCMSTVADADYIFGETTRIGISTLGKMIVYAGVSLYSSEDAYAVDTYFQPTYVINGASSVERANASQVASGNVGASNNTRTSIFSRFAAQWWNGDIGEVLVYNGVLSGANIGKVETYLNSKWAVY